MKKKSIWIVVAVLILFAAIAINMRRMHMMAGSDLPLTAVSANGATLSLSTEAQAITGKLPSGAAAQESGGMIVTFALNPYPPVSGRPSQFDLTLTDAKGQAINDATVNLDLTMPEMWMPSNQFTLGFVADGKYNATGFFTMRGWWRIEAIITRGGASQSVFFDVGL